MEGGSMCAGVPVVVRAVDWGMAGLDLPCATLQLFFAMWGV